MIVHRRFGCIPDRLTEPGCARFRLKFIKAAEISAVLEMDLEGRATHINRSRRRGAEKDTSERENGRRERGGLKKERREAGTKGKERERVPGERERERWPERPEKESRGESLMRATIQCVGRRQRAECSRLPAFRNLFSPPSASFVLSPDNMPLRERERETRRPVRRSARVYSRSYKIDARRSPDVRRAVPCTRDRREIDFSIGGICMRNYCRPVRIYTLYRTIECLLMPTAVTTLYVTTC